MVSKILHIKQILIAVFRDLDINSGSIWVQRKIIMSFTNGSVALSQEN